MENITTSNPSTIELEGYIERILYVNPQNGYTVCGITIEKEYKETITACGMLASITAGSKIKISGQWIKHPKFGNQFSIAHYTVYPPTSTEGIEKYLASGLIKGIGPTYAKRLVSHFGTKTLDIIDKNPEQLSLVPGIGAKRKQDIIAAWIDQKEIAHIMVFLQEKGVSATYAVKIYKAYKNRAIELILENPYRIAEDIWGIGFATADAIAQKLSIAADSVKRCRAALLHVLSISLQQGHVYTELEKLKENTLLLLSIEENTGRAKIKTALHDLHNQEKIKLISTADNHFITLTPHYMTEKGIALRIHEIQKTVSVLSLNITELYKQLRTHDDKKNSLNDDQQRGVMSVFSDKITIITGGPGTGKTTLVKALINLCDTAQVSYKLAAPTGRAAKRLAQSTNRQALTIHRLLEFDPAIMQFTKNSQNALDCQLLIIDEASMIDIFLMHALLKAVKNNAHLLLIGDIDQLPSVGSGNVLADSIESGSIPTVRLTHIFRQAHQSLIVTNAHRINNGDFFITYDDAIPHAKDFYFIKEDDPEKIADHLKTIFKKIIPQKQISSDQVTVLVPMNRGSVGTVALNQSIQKLLNPESTDAITYGAFIFRTGDRVMQIRNNYDKNVFNGDIGTIVSIDRQNQTLQIQFDTTVSYEFSELDELVLAYAISIHKSQGSEYDAAVIILCMQHFTLLQRKLLYTALTRAKKLCILIGQPKAFMLAIKNHSTPPRITFLRDFLITDLKAR